MKPADPPFFSALEEVEMAQRSPRHNGSSSTGCQFRGQTELSMTRRPGAHAVTRQALMKGPGTGGEILEKDLCLAQLGIASAFSQTERSGAKNSSPECTVRRAS